MKRTFWAASLLILGASTAIGQPPTEDVASWPQWRGPTRDGLVGNAADWPNSLDEETLKLTWRKDLGPSYSGPIVDEQRVYTTATREAETEVVTAYDRQTGDEIWSTEWEGAMVVPFYAASNGSWIRSTPALDENSLYVAGMRDVLVCLGKQSGDERWRVDFTKRYGTPVPSFGFVASPLVHDGAVYVQAGGGVVKVDAKTGESIWRSAVDGGDSDSAFSSPVVGEINGKKQLIVQGREQLMGIDLATGDVVWSQAIQAFRGMNILTPTLYNEKIFTSAHSGTSQLWDVAADGEVTESWKLQAQAYMSSPVVVDGHAYLHLKNQRFACINLESGEQTWRTRPYGTYWSMVIDGKRILALDSSGTIRLMEADPNEFRLIAERKISQAPTWAHLAVAGNQLFIRELEALAVYSW